MTMTPLTPTHKSNMIIKKLPKNIKEALKQTKKISPPLPTYPSMTKVHISKLQIAITSNRTKHRQDMEH